MWLLNPYRFGDPDAAAYIAAVEAADGQVLAPAVASAITAFVVGCKTDGTWDAIKASCIMAGARTLAGALVPLKGAAPTNFNFVAGDYDRKTGLAGNGSTKALNSNYVLPASTAASTHLSIFFQNLIPLNTDQGIIGGFNSSVSRAVEIFRFASDNKVYGFSRDIQYFPSGGLQALGFCGHTRIDTSTVAIRNNGISVQGAVSMTTPAADTPIGVFGRLNSPTNQFNFRTNARLSFYSIGEAIDLALLDARVTTLMNALAAAIP